MIKRERDSMGRPVCRMCGKHISGRVAYCFDCMIAARKESKRAYEHRSGRPSSTRRIKTGLPTWNPDSQMRPADESG